MFKKRINRIIEEGYELNISEIISNAYNVAIKKLFIWSILFMLMYFVIIVFFQYLAYTIAGVDLKELIDTYIELASSGNIERLNSYIMSIQGQLNYASFISWGFSLLFMPLMMGYVEMVKNVDLGLKYSFSDILKPYTSSKIVGLMIIYIAIMLLSVVGFMLCIFPGVYIMTALSLAPMMYWFNDDASFGEALTGSLKIVNKSFFNVFFAFLLLLLLSVTGMFLCYIGLIITVPISYAGFYFVYKQIFMKEENYKEIDEIGAT